MYGGLSRRQTRLLMVALFCVLPVLASLTCYASGIRCPVCFSARVSRVYRCCVIRTLSDGQVHPDFHSPLGWECGRCGLSWRGLKW
jgi:hypothetical protein